MAGAHTSERHWHQLATRNVVFNFAGRGGSALVIFLAIPALISIAGPESWGLIAFSLSLAAITSLLDLGLGAALTRDIARFAIDQKRIEQQPDLVKSYELPLALMALLIFAISYSFAGSVGTRWLSASELPGDTIVRCLQLLSPCLALQILSSLYQGGLLGMQRQLLSNSVRLAYTSALYGGGIFLLRENPPEGIVRFFEWQLLCASAYCLVLRIALYRGVQTGRGAHWNPTIFREGLRFAAGVAGTAILVVCLTQLDKLLLSRLLSLSSFGAYSIAVTLTSVQVLLVQPVHTAIYPQLTALLDQGSEEGARRLFLRWSRRVSVAVVPLGLTICLFPTEIATLWLGDPALARDIAIPVTLLSLGSLLNALCMLPYTLQLAAGWASLGFYSNLLALALMVPSVLVLTPILGMTGAALVWALLNFGYLALQMPIMFRRLLTSARLLWLRDAVAIPALLTTALLGAARAASNTLDTGTVEALMFATLGAALSFFLLARRVHRMESHSE